MKRRSSQHLLLGQQSDRKLAELARRGSDAAFEVLLRRHRADMVRAATHAAGPTGAQDAAQVAAASAWKALRAGVNVEHPRAWLVRIAARAALRTPALAAVETRDGDLSAPGADEVSAARGELAAALTALAALPERQREALLGTAVEGRSAADVGSELGLHEDAVRQLVRRARATMRSAVAAVTPTPLLLRLLAVAPDAERVAGPLGGTALGAAAIKAGVVTVVAASVVAGAAGLSHHARHDATARAATTPQAHPAAPTTQAATTPSPDAQAAATRTDHVVSRPSARRHHASGRRTHPAPTTPARRDGASPAHHHARPARGGEGDDEDEPDDQADDDDPGSDDDDPSDDDDDQATTDDDPSDDEDDQATGDDDATSDDDGDDDGYEPADEEDDDRGDDG